MYAITLTSDLLYANTVVRYGIIAGVGIAALVLIYVKRDLVKMLLKKIKK